MRNSYRQLLTALSCIAVLAVANGPVSAALIPYDAPSLACGSLVGESSLQLNVTAGLSGAPAGVTVQWMKYDEFVDNGGWLSSDDPRLCKLSMSGQPSMQHPGASRWDLASFQTMDIIISDGNFDETGVSAGNCGLDEILCGTQYIFRTFAHAGRGFGRSAWSADVLCSTLPCPADDCTHTQGYWKAKPGVQWPVSSLVLGSCNPQRTYTQSELQAIFGRPAAGNGLIILAHQLIAAKLNVAQGNCTCPSATTAIAAADALIGCLNVLTAELKPNVTSTLATALDNFNNGIGGPGCPSHASSRYQRQTNPGDLTPSSTWGAVKAIYR